MKAKLLNIVISVTLLGLMFTGCNSGSSDSGTQSPGNGANPTLSTTVAVGAMTKGSIKLNGVEFQPSATITVTEDNITKPESFLDNGMTVKVKGTVNADGRHRDCGEGCSGERGKGCHYLKRDRYLDDPWPDRAD